MTTVVTGRTATSPRLRAAWTVSPRGFAELAPLTGSLWLLTTGRLEGPTGTPGAATTQTDDAPIGPGRAVRQVLEDLALIEGHDAASLYERAGATLRARGLGQLDSLALLSRTDERLDASVTGLGTPRPLVVTARELAAPANPTDGTRLGPGWAVVLGGAEAGGSLLSPGEVQAALGMVRGDDPASRLPQARTLLAVIVGG